MAEAPRHRVVIVGGGFGGAAAARALARVAVDATLADRVNRHLFQPLLYQVATGILSEGSIAPPLRGMFRHQANVRVLLAEVTSIDLDARGRAGPRRRRRRPRAPRRQPDRRRRVGRQLVRPSRVGGPRPRDDDARGRAPPAQQHPRGRRDGRGERGRRRARGLADVRDRGRRPHRRGAHRAGRDASLGDAAPRLPRDRHHRDPHRAGGARPGGARRLPRQAPGAGRARPEPDCSLPGRPEVFAIGDVASLDALPGVAQPAIQEGRYAAAVVEARPAGWTPPPPFGYFDKGSMATIGRKRAVADAFGVRVAGRTAKAMWAVVHIAYLVGWSNRVGTTMRWMWTLASRNRRERLISPSREDAAGL